MEVTLKVVENFYPFPEELRACALSLPDRDEVFDGHVYKGWRRYEHPNFQPMMESMLSRVCGGQVSIVMGAFVAATSKVSTTQWIHADNGIGTHACVLHLHHGKGGTAFWKHLETGEHRMGPSMIEKLGGVTEAPAKLQADGEFQDRWQMLHLAGAQFNTLAVFDSQVFHSRYPKQSFGETPDDCRLTWVAFFNVEGAIQ